MAKKKNIILIVVIAFLYITSCSENQTGSGTSNADSSAIANSQDADELWVAPDTSLIPANDSGRMILYGKSLIVNTAKYFGPKGSLVHITNGQNCQNCHLDAGTRPFGNNYGAVAAHYPKYTARSGQILSIANKVNECFTRSLNGKALDEKSKEMNAIVAYIKWLGYEVEKGASPKGTGLLRLQYLNRAADTSNGRIVFEKNCVSCHGNEGAGMMNEDGISFQYPPLWGTYTYNNSATFYRISKLAGFIKPNMPYLRSSYSSPVLSDNEAWDVAAYINSRPRPQRDHSADYIADISKKPFDFPFAPYSDGFNESQHKYGPYAPIVAANKKDK